MTEAGLTPTTRQAYLRLLRRTRPYRGRLLVGIVAAILCGGSTFGLLQVVPRALGSFEVSRGIGTSPAAARTEGAPASEDALPSWFVKAERVAARYQLPLRRADGAPSWQCLALSLIGLPLIVLLRAAAVFLNHYCMRWLGARVVRDLRDDLFDTLQRQSLTYFGSCDVGGIISRCVNDTAAVEHVIATTIADATQAPMQIAGALVFGVIFALDNHMVGFLLTGAVAFPLCIVPIAVLGGHVKRWTRRSLERISEVVSRMHEVLTGIRVVKAFHTEATEALRFREVNARYFQAVVRALRAELLMSPAMEGISILLACAFVIYCYTRGMRMSQIIPIGIVAVLIYKPMKQLTRISPAIQRAGAALDRVFRLLDTDTALPESPHPVRKAGFEDRVVFDQVGFRFAAQGPVILTDVSFEIRRGSVVALVGETGSGKTTLANLLARFYDPTEGGVSFDGVDLREIAVPDLRRLVGVVTQETILFNDTVASNIAYGTPDATTAQIEAAAKLANAHGFIVEHPDGYGRVVGEKGFTLSGGERQRVALARAILRNPPILILDEATSALDTVTERLVQEAIARVMANRTVLAIAHRLGTVRRADLILVVDGGRIVERGTHASLHAAGGLYRRLCDMQFTEQA